MGVCHLPYTVKRVVLSTFLYVLENGKRPASTIEMGRLNCEPLTGFEPATYALQERRSSQLSYKGVPGVFPGT